jgi:tetratricopeptide (TPR) repeat protein
MSNGRDGQREEAPTNKYSSGPPLERLAVNLGVDLSTLTRVTNLIIDRGVTIDGLGSSVKEFAERYRELVDRVGSAVDADDDVQQLHKSAVEAIKNGDLASADSLLAEAFNLEARRSEASPSVRTRRMKSQAESAAKRAILQLELSNFSAAAERFSEAAELSLNDPETYLSYLVGQADSLVALGKRFGAKQKISHAIDIYKSMLERNDLDTFPTINPGMVYLKLAKALGRLGEFVNNNSHIEEALKAIDSSLKYWDRDHTPLEWAQAQNDLGDVLVSLGRREAETATLERAVGAYREALKEWTRDRVPLDWARAQNALGNALAGIGSREGGTVHLEQAIQAYGEALKEWTRDRVPLEWARVHNDLGNAFVNLGWREGGTARVEQAIEAYSEALKEWTRDRVPLHWARVHNGLGNAFVNLAWREASTAHFEQAIEAYREALKEWTRERVPLDWARAQAGLANALAGLGGREGGTARFEQAIEAYQAALKEWTRNRAPLDWARAQNGLGNTLVNLALRENSIAGLEQAITTYHEALKEWTRERVPLDWARISVQSRHRTRKSWNSGEEREDSI